MEKITKENSVHFVVKKVWFDKLKSGEKTHEYRIHKPYWAVRLTYRNPMKFIPKPLKYAKFSLGMTKDLARNMVFEIKDIRLDRADNTDLLKMYPELKDTSVLAYDVVLGKRIL